MKRAKIALVAGLALLATSFLTTMTLTTVAAFFPGFPIVGGAAYCVSFVMNPLTGAATTTCNGPTVPAGPTVITGNETWPIDTNLSQGRAPQTVLVKSAALGVGPYQYNAPLTGASLTVQPTDRRMILEPAATIATLTITLPAATLLVDNQQWGVCSTQVVTALTITPGAGTTVSNTQTATIVPAATGAASCAQWIYRQANTNWYRTQ